MPLAIGAALHRDLVVRVTPFSALRALRAHCLGCGHSTLIVWWRPTLIRFLVYRQAVRGRAGPPRRAPRLLLRVKNRVGQHVFDRRREIRLVRLGQKPAPLGFHDVPDAHAPNRHHGGAGRHGFGHHESLGLGHGGEGEKVGGGVTIPPVVAGEVTEKNLTSGKTGSGSDPRGI